jgi:hypothetical protein
LAAVNPAVCNNFLDDATDEMGNIDVRKYLIRGANFRYMIFM